MYLKKHSHGLITPSYMNSPWEREIDTHTYTHTHPNKNYNNITKENITQKKYIF